MTKLISVTKNHLPDKKLDATFETDGRRKTTAFGARGYDDYTKAHDKSQRDRYRNRHAKDLRSGDPTSAGHLSYYLLWGQHPSLRANLADYKRRFNL